VLGEQTGVYNAGHAQRPAKGPAPHCQLQARRVGMYVSTPARSSAGHVGHYACDRHAIALAWRLGIDCDDPQ
jgi:hypothetical protein